MCTAFCLQAGCRERSSRIRAAIHNLAPELLHAKRSFTRAATDRPGRLPDPHRHRRNQCSGYSRHCRGGRDHAYRKRPRRENSRPGWPNARRWTWCCGFVEQTAWEKRCTAGTTLTAGSRRRVRTSLPGWPSTFARCTKRISIRGFASTASQVSRLTELLGHPPRSYAEFAAEAARRWRAAA